MKISAIVHTLNEEKNIVRCLSSLSWVNEIIIVDMYSTDKTVELAKKFTSKIYTYKRTGYVEPARNYAISKASGEWIFILDADEEVGQRLTSFLQEISEQDLAYTYYLIPRKNIVFGRFIKHALWWPDYQIRFFKKGYVKWQEEIHSIPLTRGESKQLPAKEELAITHYNYQSVDQFLERILHYTTIEAKQRLENGYDYNFTDILRKPKDEFFSRFFYGKGYLDGIHGLVLSMLQVFYEFLVVIKIWEAKDFKQQRQDQFIKQFIDNYSQNIKMDQYWLKKLKLDSEKNWLKKVFLRICK